MAWEDEMPLNVPRLCLLWDPILEPVNMAWRSNGLWRTHSIASIPESSSGRGELTLVQSFPDKSCGRGLAMLELVPLTAAMAP